MSAGLVAALLATTGPVAPSVLAAPPRDQKPTILGTSVLSVRRAPGWMQRVVEDQRLTSRLQAAMANPALSGPFSASCLVVSQGSKVLYDDGSTRELVPASNMKLLTATAALDKLGPAYRFTTTVDASQAPARGVLKGNLYLVGGGDPFLRTAAYLNEFNPPQPLYTPLAQLAAQVRAAGITRITGSVVGNDGRYDSVRSVPGWKPVYVSEGDAGPLSALDVDDGFPPPGVPPAPVATPPVEAAAAFTQLLKADGVKVVGLPASGPVWPGFVPVTSIHSAPLWEVVDEILTVSDDTGAELLTKELGRDFGGAGTTAAGTAVIRADLAAHGYDIRRLVNYDGSGLDGGNRVTCGLLLSVLQRHGPSGPLAAGLPVAGETGTLVHRMQGTPAAGRVRAKTGTLQDVSALSGFVLPAHAAGPRAEPLVFSLLMNGVTGATGVATGDGVAEALASYPAAPPAKSLGPLRVGTGW